MLIGGAGAKRSGGAWRQAYRALEHVKAKEACRNREWMRKFPKPIADFANMFVTMQQKRHAADYDPMINLTKSEVANDIDLVERAVEDFKGTPAKDRRAFCIYVLFKMRA
jgi:hypothetical protein